MKDEYKVIENHLKNYEYYKMGVRNMKRQKENLYPSITSQIDEVGGGRSGSFEWKSKTEETAIKRIERSFDLLEADIRQYELVISSIDEALENLAQKEKRYVELRYFQKAKMERVAAKLNYSKRNMYNMREQVLGKLYISLKHLLNVSG